ncbi:MAG: ABC transporter substrate-binding protein [Acidimicrobiales bacterium]
MGNASTAGSRGIRRFVLLLVFALLAGACASGESGGEEGSDSDNDTSTDEEAGPAQSGGSMVYGLEAETENGWCLPSARLAIAGIQVARSIYDTLTMPDGEGGFEPHLAQSVEPNEDFTQWTIELREGVTFHDGSELTADVVKNNLDAYRGENPDIAVDLFLFVFQDVTAVEATGPMTVTVTTARPWVAFPSFLYSSGRLGMMAQAQMDDAANCSDNMIGTGPFQLEEWQLNNHLTVVRNESYWRTDSEGNQLPYLDEIEYRPITESQQRLNALQSGEIDAFHASSNTESLTLTELQSLAEDGEINLTISNDFAEVGNLMLNTTEPPFDNPIAREAAGLAIDRETINETLANGYPELANGPFPPGTLGYLEDTGYGAYDPEEAASLVEQYQAETGQPLEVQISSTPSPELRQLVDAVSGYWEDAGMVVNTTTFDQSQLITTAVNRDYQAITWRNYPQLDPDNLYVWWYGAGNPVNFMGFDDPEVNDLLDRGRAATDEAEREEIYQDLNRELASEHYMLWTSWTDWAIPHDSDLHGVVGARPVDTDGDADYTGLALGHDPALMWREQ